MPAKLLRKRQAEPEAEPEAPKEPEAKKETPKRDSPPDPTHWLLRRLGGVKLGN